MIKYTSIFIYQNLIQIHSFHQIFNTSTNDRAVKFNISELVLFLIYQVYIYISYKLP